MAKKNHLWAKKRKIPKPNCPQCNDNKNVMPLEYGYAPSGRPGFHWVGCVISPNNWCCQNCADEFGQYFRFDSDDDSDD